MNPPIRLIDTGLRPARWNVAMTAALAELHQAGRIGDTLRLHVYPRCVLVGRNQPLAAAADLRFCRERRIEIARRVTGGGAVYMSPGVLAWDLLLGRRSAGRPDDAAARICAAVAAGLSRLGLAARYRPPNEVESGGRKLAGASGFFDGPSLVHQGAILIDPDRAEMAAGLALPEPALRERIVTLRELTGRVPGHGEIAAALVAALTGALARPIAQDEISEPEQRLAGELLDGEIGADGFVEGRDLVAASPAVEAEAARA